MSPDATLPNGPRRRFLAVDWRESVWRPRVVVRRPALAPGFWVPAFRRPRFAFSNTMKTNLPPSRRDRAGFTLIELLVVIAIIGILASILLPVLAAVHRHGLVVKASLQIQAIDTAIEGYDSTYSRFPVSTKVQKAAGTGDFTYGGTGHNASGVLTWTLGTPVPDLGNVPMTNSDVIAILMDLTNFPGGGWTSNTNYEKNPQQHPFLNAHMSGDTSSPGVGTDLVYRDPWGNPYLITMDLNYNGMCVDAVYGKDKVSNDGSGNGLNGLIRDPSVPAPDNWAYRGKVMVWSAGPDGKIDPTVPANQGVNKDNILSWQ